MNNKSTDTSSSLKFYNRFWSIPHRNALAITWIVTVVVLVIILLSNVRNTDEFTVVRYVLQVAYVSALLWYISRVGPSVNQLPELLPIILPHWKYGRWIPVVGIALMLVLTIISDDGVGILLLLLIIATVWILIAWRRDIRLYMLLQGLAVAIIAYVGGSPFPANGFIGNSTFYLLLILVPPTYIAGGLLLNRTNLGGIQLITGRYVKALQSFLWGCVLFIPLGLFNAAEGSPGSDITWVTEWWMTLSLPWFSGIAEETLFRLLLVGLCYLLLRPAFHKYPALTVIAAILFSAITFGLGHGRTLDNLLTTGLLYGLPMAAIFARRDWEHAVGAHYMINMIPWVMVFLES